MDWKTIINEIMCSGYTMAEIARHAEVEPGTIRALRRGLNQCPRWVTGNLILELHTKTRKKRKDKP